MRINLPKGIKQKIRQLRLKSVCKSTRGFTVKGVKQGLRVTELTSICVYLL